MDIVFFTKNILPTKHHHKIKSQLACKFVIQPNSNKMEVQPPRRMISLTIMLLLCPNLIPAFTFSTVSTPASISSLRNNQMQMPMNSIQSSLPSQFQFQFQLNAIAEAMPSSQMSSSDNSNRKKKPMSFEERMRELALRRSTTPARISGPPSRRQRTSTSTSTQNARPANLLLVETLEDYKQVVGEENQQITVVRFFATWCKVRYFLQNFTLRNFRNLSMSQFFLHLCHPKPKYSVTHTVMQSNGT